MRKALVFAMALTAVTASAPAVVEAQVAAESQIAESIVDRQPNNPGNAFAADVGSVSCWSNVMGAEGSTIQHVWIHGDMEFPVTLQIAGSPWRTWSSKTIPPEWSGEWRVEVRDAEGNLLDTLAFTVGG